MELRSLEAAMLLSPIHFALSSLLKNADCSESLAVTIFFCFFAFLFIENWEIVFILFDPKKKLILTATAANLFLLSILNPFYS